MSHLNVEFKASVPSIELYEQKLQSLQPRFAGEDHQVDTYFNVPEGRLKLREGNIENALIFYERPDTAGSKHSKILLYQHQPEPVLKEILTRTNGIKAIVDKRRRIYFIDNVKFHFDLVKSLGTFIEVEAIDQDGSIGAAKLQAQCDHYGRFFDISPDKYIAVSYSDMILAK